MPEAVRRHSLANCSLFLQFSSVNTLASLVYSFCAWPTDLIPKVSDISWSCLKKPTIAKKYALGCLPSQRTFRARHSSQAIATFRRLGGRSEASERRTCESCTLDIVGRALGYHAIVDRRPRTHSKQVGDAGKEENPGSWGTGSLPVEAG